MTGNQEKKHEIVVMDGTNVTDLRVVLSTVKVFTGKRDVSYHPLSKDFPTMLVIDIETTDVIFERLQKALDEYYPGLCVFDPHM